MKGRESRGAADFSNVYDDPRRAEAYARLEFPGTYYLAYRDLPALIREHVTGRRALDFGCGAGRSTRFLRQLGFAAAGVDVAPDMLDRARALDPEGDYRLLGERGLAALEPGSFDLVLSAFTFDNIPGEETKVSLFTQLRSLLAGRGRMLNLVSSPEIYTHEWASFTTRAYPENKLARPGDRVRIVMTDVEDSRPVEDIVWPDADYRRVYARAGLEVLRMHAPLALPSEPFAWVNETRIAPWVIYVLKAASTEGRHV